MNLRIKYCLIIFLLSCILLSEEILFAENVGVSFNIGTISDSKVFFDGEDKERKFVNIYNASFSILFKNSFQFKYLYLNKNNIFPSFDLPYSGYYNEYSFYYYVKNKTTLNLNFNIGYKYFFDSHNIFNTSTLLIGVSKENSNTNFTNYSQIEFLYTVPNHGSSNFAFKLSYPINMDFLPKDNVPSLNSFHLSPAIIILNNDVYISLDFGLIHQFK